MLIPLSSLKFEPIRWSFCVFIYTIALLNQQLGHIRLRGVSNILSDIIHQNENKKLLNDLFFTTTTYSESTTTYFKIHPHA